jgi:hypothetical protein
MKIDRLLMKNIAAIAAVVVFFVTIFVPAWSRMETDFPNYYTAAKLLRSGQPLHDFYDWTWFQRQMSYAGFPIQLGAYSPQTPLATLPYAPFARFPPLVAKRIWISLSLVFLAATIVLLSRMTSFVVSELILLAFCAYLPLRTGFRYGQYYFFLLFLLTLAVYLASKKEEGKAGFLFGLAFVLKLYGGPFLFYFVVKRKWKAVAVLIAAMFCGGLCAAMIFGWRDLLFYATNILPRALKEGCVDPYTPGNQTLSTFFMHFLTPEPQLNPTPLLNAPWLAFFLRTFASLSILAGTALGLVFNKEENIRKDLAWFAIAILLLTTNIASYVFIVLLLPVAILMDSAMMKSKLFLFFCFLCLVAPTPSRFAWLFPKVWLLFALFIFVGIAYWRYVPFKAFAVVAMAVVVLATLDARNYWLSYLQEPARKYELIKMNELSASSPAISKWGLFYQAIGTDRYVLRWVHQGERGELSLDGHILLPNIADPNVLVQFELVSHGVSESMAYYPWNQTLIHDNSFELQMQAPRVAVSPDRQWIAWVSSEKGTQQVWLRKSDGTGATKISGGRCNSSSPAWELDSSGVIFASDCGRGYGLSALYRARLTQILGTYPELQK